jgi:hypothetical protein
VVPVTVRYRVYGAAAPDGPVDDAAPIADVAGLSWATPPLAAGANPFLVRAYDDATGLEEQGVGARVDILIDAAGADLTARPGPVAGLAARPTGPGTCRIEWAYPPAAEAAAGVAEFCVWLTAGAAVDFAAAPATTVPATWLGRYRVDLAGLTPGATHAVAVRAAGPAGDDGSTFQVLIITPAAAPAPVEGLAAVAVP